MTRRASVLIYVSLLLFAAAALLVSTTAAALAAVILLLAFPLLSMAWNAVVCRNVRAQIRVPTLASKAQAVEGTVHIRCRGIPAGRIVVQAAAENELTGTVDTLALELTGQGDDYSAAFSFESRFCGCVRFSVRSVFFADAFDILRLRKPVDAAARCTVLPHTFPIEIADPSLPDSAAEADTYLDVGGGSDFTEVYRLREYVPGDSVRGMHWKLSSKLDTLLYRDPALAVQRSLLLFWDKAHTQPDIADALAEAVFSTAEALHDRGIVFTLAVPQPGEVHLQTVTDEETLLQTLPLLLRSTVPDAGQPDVTGFGRTLWFTSRTVVPAADTVTALYCTNQPSPDMHGIVFTPRTVRETLHRLDWNYET